MSFWKNYPNRKDWRKPSRKASYGCFPNGSCGYCRDNRLHCTHKRERAADDQIEEFKEESNSDTMGQSV